MKALFISFMVLLGLAGCAANTAGVQIDGQKKSVFFNDSSLESNLKVEKIMTTYVDGHAKGIVQLSSTSRSDQAVLYRFYWYDNTGLEVNTQPGPWRKKIIRGFEPVEFSEVSVRPTGTQFRVQIRQAQDD